MLPLNEQMNKEQKERSRQKPFFYKITPKTIFFSFLYDFPKITLSLHPQQPKTGKTPGKAP